MYKSQVLYQLRLSYQLAEVEILNNWVDSVQRYCNMACKIVCANHSCIPLCLTSKCLGG